MMNILTVSCSLSYTLNLKCSYEGSLMLIAIFIENIWTRLPLSVAATSRATKECEEYDKTTRNIDLVHLSQKDDRNDAKKVWGHCLFFFFLLLEYLLYKYTRFFVYLYIYRFTIYLLLYFSCSPYECL